MFNRLGGVPANIAEIEQQLIVDNSGVIRFEDFRNFMLKQEKTELPQLTTKQLKIFEQKHSKIPNKIDVDDFKHCLKVLGSCMSQQDVEDLMSNIRTEDGQFKIEDLLKLLRKLE